MEDNQVRGQRFPFSPLERIHYNHRKKTERIPATLPPRLGKARSGERCSLPGWNQRRKAPSFSRGKMAGGLINAIKMQGCQVEVLGECQGAEGPSCLERCLLLLLLPQLAVTCAAPPAPPLASPLPRHGERLAASGLAETQLLGGKGLWGVQARRGHEGHRQTGCVFPSFVLRPQLWGSVQV